MPGISKSELTYNIVHIEQRTMDIVQTINCPMSLCLLVGANI